ncbi:MAG: hypothetical protein ACP5HQ_01595 [Thermoprotei archaeon]
MSVRSLGYYARTVLSKYGEFVDYQSIVQLSSFSVYIVVLVIVGVLNNYLSRTYLPIVGLPLFIAAVLSSKLSNVQIALSSANSFKVWLDYLRSNKIFRFLEVRVYPINALATASSILFLKLMYVNEQTFTEYISIVLIAGLIAQAIGALLPLKWKMHSARGLLLLSLPAISTEYVFPFISGEVIPVTILGFLESIIGTYVFVHVNSIYSYIVNKDVYVNISVVQGVLTQAASSVMAIAISAIATLVGLTYTYIGIASLMTLIVLLTIFSSVVEDIKIEK